jgi:FkbM family methyltransferase
MEERMPRDRKIALREWFCRWTRRWPEVRGRGRLILAVDRWLTDSRDPHSYLVRSQLNGNIQMRLDLRSWDQKFAFYYGESNREALRRIAGIFSEGDFWDVGASIGVFAVTMGLHARAWDGRVIAVEPHPINVATLKENVNINGVEGHVVVEQVAVGSQPGSVRISLGLDAIAGNAVAGGTEGEHVSVVTLDDLWLRHGSRKAGFLKIDTEGWDAPALMGGRKMLRACRPALLAEFNRHQMKRQNIQIEECWSFLIGELGYTARFPNANGRLQPVGAPGDLEDIWFLPARSA